MEFYIGVDIGGTFIKFGVVSKDGVVIHEEKVETGQVGIEIISKIKEFYLSQKEKHNLLGLGLSLPGIVSEDGLMRTAGAIKDFIGVNVKELLQNEIDIPVKIISDSNAAAAAEAWNGKGRNIKNFVCLTLGTAVGGAIYIDGKLYKGLEGLAGEFGVALMERESPSYKEQSYSMHAGVVAGLCRNYSLKVKERILDAEEIFKRSKNGDLIAKECIQEFYSSISRLLITVALTVAPDVILVGGGISNNREVMDNIINEYKKICVDYKVLSMVSMPRIEICHHKNNAGLIGAVSMFINERNE
ncbi:ROK family protein [Clostridium sp.]|uniref:ROK family protein n=1 Tax=Clostridium sp. TaxID=1506 RepID=UPI0025C2B7DE|nr:ROK family protein [Clostridium sp.]